MTVICWGALGKAAGDDTTIDQEINTYITRHDENPNAHMGEDYALGVHRLQVVLDHAEGSVNLFHLVKDHIFGFSAFETFDCWTKVGLGSPGLLGALLQTAVGDPPQEAYLISNHQYLVGWPVDKNPFFQTTVYILSSTGQEGHIICGSYYQTGLGEAFGFKFVNDTLYAYWVSDETEYSQELAGLPAHGLHCYRAYIDSAEGKMYFYVDGVLRYTATANLPLEGGQYLAEYWIKKTGADLRVMYPVDWMFQRDR
jgi:hypothetical protein